MRVSIFLTSIFMSLFAALLPAPLMAAEIRAEVVDLRPIFPLRLNIDVTGPIQSGDSGKLQTTINQHVVPEMRDISITFDSPGGSLYEGMRMAGILRDATPIVSADVGKDNSVMPECASACVIAYMGADLRYLRDGAKIGVHQFSDATGLIDADVAIDVAQRMSSKIVNLMQAQGIDHAFLDRMSNTEAHDIDWVSREDLLAWRVVNNGVYDERMEYKNVNGKVALYMIHESILGTNQMTLYCEEGMIGYAMLDEPELAMIGDLRFVLDEREYRIDDFEVLNRDNARTRVVFHIPSSAVSHMQSARTIGARVYQPSGDTFYGFLQDVRDQKVSELAQSCESSHPPTEPRNSPPRMKEISNTDIPGHDLTSEGFRNVTFAWCKQACLKNDHCVAVSYVQSKSWCWPKGNAGSGSHAPGIISAVRN